MKKHLTFILFLIALTALFTPVRAEYVDVPAYDECYPACARLADLGIIAGYEDGTFRPDNAVTRAEFTKIIVCLMDKEAEARANTGMIGFSDIDAYGWYVSYIRYAVSNDILSGYADGTFHPNDTINLQEAITILLRTLGYKEAEIGYFWPNNYLTAAYSLELTRDIPLAPQDAVTRKYAAILTDRALFSKPSLALSQADTYLETTGYTVLEDSLILSKDPESSSITVLAGNLKQNTAVSYLGKTQIPASAGEMYRYAVIDKNGYLATLCGYTQGTGIASVSGVFNKFTDNTVEYTTYDGVKNTYNADNGFLFYRGSERMTLAQAKASLEKDTDITFYGDSYGLWNIAVVGNADTIAPVLASTDYYGNEEYLEYFPINYTNLTVHRNGEAAGVYSIKSGDVVYYNTKSNVMDVYSDRITGKYDSAYPSKAYVEKITVGGKEYVLDENGGAKEKLDASSGAFQIGDNIMLLLGKDDKVAFVTDNSQGFNYYSQGVIVQASKNYYGNEYYLESVPINYTKLTVHKNGEASSVSAIKSGDVVYYNTKTNVMDVYDKKISGTYYSAYPSKAYVEKVTVGGAEYEIDENGGAKEKLDASSGAFQIGDKITLLLGKDDKVAFVSDNSHGFDYYSYGVIIKSERKVASSGANEGMSEPITTLFMADGKEHDIVTDKLYRDSIGKLAYITYLNGSAQLSVETSGDSEKFAGAINKNDRTINLRYVLKDAVIIQRTSDDDDTNVTCELLDFNKLTAPDLSKTQILNVISGNKFDDIAIMYVCDLENTHSFGVIAGFDKSNEGKTSGYKILSDGYQSSYRLSVGKINTSIGAPVQFKLSNGAISDISQLYQIVANRSMTAAEEGRIYVEGKIYRLSDNVQIVDVSDTSNLKALSVDNLAKMSSPSVSLYSDKADGIIRVITVRK